MYTAILKNINYVLKEAISKDLIPKKRFFPFGDWRDSFSGLGWGTYSVAVNTGHVPTALLAIFKLF